MEDEREDVMEDREDLDSRLSREAEDSRCCCISGVEMFSSVPVVAVVDCC